MACIAKEPNYYCYAWPWIVTRQHNSQHHSAVGVYRLTLQATSINGAKKQKNASAGLGNRTLKPRHRLVVKEYVRTCRGREDVLIAVHAVIVGPSASHPYEAETEHTGPGGGNLQGDTNAYIHASVSLVQRTRTTFSPLLQKVTKPQTHLGCPIHAEVAEKLPAGGAVDEESHDGEAGDHEHHRVPDIVVNGLVFLQKQNRRARTGEAVCGGGDKRASKALFCNQDVCGAEKT